MKAPAFRYLRARSIADACAMLAEHGADARILAGGQSLMPVLNLRLANPAVLVDINPVAEMAGISVDQSTVRIGALTRYRDIQDSPIIRQHLGLIADALPFVAHAAIRNRGTIGGSLATADPAAEMPACCLALDARMILESTRGQRKVPADEFFRSTFETALEPDELLTKIEFPIEGPDWRHAFAEFSRRHGDFAIVGAAARARLNTRRFADIRVVMFGIADRPMRIYAAEKALLSAANLKEGIAAAQATLAKALEPPSDNQTSSETRLHLARVLLGRALAQLDDAVD
jgi:carbon-monoxide dehydrogenase medium subunit